MVLGKFFSKNFSVLMKDMYTKVREVHRVLCSINYTVSTSRRTVLRMENAIENILKIAEEREQKH